MKARRSLNFTENKENGIQRYGGDCGSHTNVSYLADAASGFVMPVGVGVRCGLQEEEERNQRQGNEHCGGQPATWPWPA
jgi:hypothetical protein